MHLSIIPTIFHVVQHLIVHISMKSKNIITILSLIAQCVRKPTAFSVNKIIIMGSNAYKKVEY